MASLYSPYPVRYRLPVPDDPKDDYLVALARVSGDPHLVGPSLRQGTVPVLTPRQFSNLL